MAKTLLSGAAGALLALVLMGLVAVLLSGCGAPTCLDSRHVWTEAGQVVRCDGARGCVEKNPDTYRGPAPERRTCELADGGWL